MDTMGKIWMIAASLAGMAAVSCSGDGYEPGQEDVENCPDVYFDAGQSGNLSISEYGRYNHLCGQGKES